VLPAGAAGPAEAAPLNVAAHRSAKTIDVRIPARASAAHNSSFMSESPFI
jgi:hypothetical protein